MITGDGDVGTGLCWLPGYELHQAMVVGTDAYVLNNIDRLKWSTTITGLYTKEKDHGKRVPGRHNGRSRPTGHR